MDTKAARRSTWIERETSRRSALIPKEMTEETAVGSLEHD